MTWPMYPVEGGLDVEGQLEMDELNYDASYGQGSQGNEMTSFVHGAWEGQVGVQTGEVMHPAPGTAVFVRSSVRVHGAEGPKIFLSVLVRRAPQENDPRSCTLHVWLQMVALAVPSPTWCPCTSAP